MPDFDTDFRIAIDEAVEKTAQKIFTRSQENILKNGSFDTGFMLRSGTMEKKPEGIEIVYSAPYAAFVEFGTDPHLPSIEPLKEWVRRKLGVRDPKEKNRIAWSIAKNIEKNGLDPKPFLRPAIREITRSVV